MSVVEDTEGADTYSFPVDGRERWVQRMKAAGYMEFPQWADDENVQRAISMGVGFFCGTCEYMVRVQSSPTGYWCKKFGMPDQPWGCSNGYEWKGSD